jgi:hypothetical protein
MGGGLGAPGVLGVAGKEPTAAKAAETRGTGKESVEGIVAELAGYYDDLDKANAITNPDEGVLSNAKAYASSSALGQTVGKVFGTKPQSARNKIEQLRPRLLSAVMQATGMSARQLDSNAELKLWLSASTDPKLDVAANREALTNISNLYGLGGAQGGGGAAAPAMEGLPPAAKHKGKRIRDRETGQIFVSDGMTWKPQ